MKKITLLVVLLFLGTTMGFGEKFTYTDVNGVTWEYYLYREDSYWDDYCYDYKYSFYEGIFLTGMRGNDSNVIIPDKLPVEDILYDVIIIGQSDNLFSNKNNIHSVTLPKTIQIITSYAFNNCSSLTSIVIPDIQPQLGYAVFNNCDELTNIKFTADVTNVTITNLINNSAFKECPNLTNLTVDSENPYFTSVDGVLYDKNLTTILLFPTGKSGKFTVPSSVVCIRDRVFKSNCKLTEIDASGVTDFGVEVFSNCTALKKVAFSNKLKKFSNYMFHGCTQLSEFNFPDSLVNIGNYAFSGCSSLQEIVVPEHVSNIGYYAFSGCNIVKMVSLQPIDLNGKDIGKTCILVNPAALATYRQQWSNMNLFIFPNDSYMQDLTLTAMSKSSSLHAAIGEDNLENVMTLKISGTINSYDFMIIRNKMTRLKNLDLTDATIVANSFEYYTGYSTSDNTLSRYSIPDNIQTLRLPNNLLYISAYALSGLNNLSKIKIPGTVKAIDDHSFYNCKSLESVIIDYGVKSIGSEAFRGCQYLTNLSLPAGLQTIGDYAFADCRGLRELTLPEGLKTIGVGAFCLRDGELDEEGPQTLGYDPCKHLNLPKTLTSIGNYAFSNCRLAELLLPENLEFIGEKAFAYNYDLKKLIIPSKVKSISDYAFMNCGAIDSISLPIGLEYIAEGAFYWCSSLKQIKIPETIKQIGEKAFYGCKSLENVYTYTLQPTSIAQNTFSTYNSSVLNVPLASYYLYYFNTQWSQFKYIRNFPGIFSDVYIVSDYEIDTKTPIVGKPNITLQPGSGLIVFGHDTIQEFDTIRYMHNGEVGATIRGGKNIKANVLDVQIVLYGNKWYFLGCPDWMQNQLPTNTQKVIYRYDGSTRAQNGSGGWKKISSLSSLRKDEGFIIQTDENTTLEFFGSLADSAFIDTLDTDRIVRLQEYKSNNSQDQGWNLVFNPFLAYYDINDLDYDAPITIWEGNGYVAVRPSDDSYQLGPLMGFFVQKPSSTDSIYFKADYRLTRNEALAVHSPNGFQASPIVSAEDKRLFVNLSFSDDNYTDKTRIVFNEEASTEYEIECDAAKFMSTTSVPQIYSINGEVSYAINERQTGDGTVKLGVSVPKSGYYSFQAERMDIPCYLYDSATNTSWNLSNGAFQTRIESGQTDNRFYLSVSGDLTSVIETEGIQIVVEKGRITVFNDIDAEVTIHTTSGMYVGNSTVDVPAGIYLVTVNGTVTKVIVK